MISDDVTVVESVTAELVTVKAPEVRLVIRPSYERSEVVITRLEQWQDAGGGLLGRPPTSE